MTLTDHEKVFKNTLFSQISNDDGHWRLERLQIDKSKAVTQTACLKNLILENDPASSVEAHAFGYCYRVDSSSL